MSRRHLGSPVLLALAALLLFGCAREKVFTIQPFAPTAGNRALQPCVQPWGVWWPSKDWWTKRHQEILADIRKGPVDLILVGDSITNMWDQHPDLWNTYFAPLHAANLGIGGDQTQHVLWRLNHGDVDGLAPKLAVVMIGTNNSNGDEFTAEQIADGIVAVCRELRIRLPRTKILLLAIFPRGPRPNAQRAKNAKASLLASRIADNKMIFYLDLNDKFLKSDGTLTPDIMPDLLHPNAKGYQIWADAMLPTVKELMAR